MTTIFEGAAVVPNTLIPGSSIKVDTKNHHYQLECLGGDAIRISGHPVYCPQPMLAQLQGSMDKDGRLEAGLIGCGRRLVFFLNNNDDHPVTTSRIVSVQVDEPAAARPQSGWSMQKAGSQIALLLLAAMTRK